MGTCLLLACAMLCLPGSRARTRLHGVTGTHLPGARGRRRPGRGVVAEGTGFVIAVAAAFLILGPAGALAGGLLCVVGWRRWKARIRSRAAVASLAGVSAALATLVAELRAGAHPAVAVESAAEDAGGAGTAAGMALQAVGSSARLGGDIDATLISSAASTPALRRPLGQLARAWTLAQRHGLPLAEVLDFVRRDLDAGARLATTVHARMAGPRTSAVVLAALPLLGLLLGEAMGAGPLDVLASSAAGQVLLLLGVGLVCAGVSWSDRLTGHELLR